MLLNLILVVVIILSWALIVQGFRANLTLVRQRMRLHGAVAQAREAFWRYAEIHRAKQTAEGDKKALANNDLAIAMDVALKATDYQELGPVQQHILNAGRALERGRRIAEPARD